MERSLQHEKFIYMTTRPIKRLICQMALPSIGSMLITALYNMADTFFVGKISTEATGAVGVVFSYMSLLQAVAFFFGQGSGNYISRALGREQVEDAGKMAATGFFSAILVGTAFIVPGLLLMKPFLRFLGATETILPDALRYFTYILFGSPFIMGSFVLNNQMRLQGNASLSVIGIASGALLNIALDPLFIFGFKLGVQGAAMATCLSQMTGFLLLLSLSGKRGGIPIRWKSFAPGLRRYAEIAAGGLPSLCRQGLASVAVLALNRAAGLYGDSAIAAFSVVSRISLICSSCIIGFGQGFQPVCGFNYGAGRIDRVERGYWFCVRVSTAAMLVLGACAFIFAEPLVRLFRADDAALVSIAATALRCHSAAFPLLGFVTMTNMFLQNTRKTARATVLAMARQGLAFLPALLLLSRLYGLWGIQLTQPVADGLTFVLALPFAFSALREMRAQREHAPDSTAPASGR